MNTEHIRKLQASIDALQSQLTAVYAAIMTQDIHDIEKRKDMKRQISEEWTRIYEERKSLNPKQ